MKPKKLICGLTVSALLFSACGRGPGASDFAPTEDSLYITGQGAVTSAVIETYSNDYYTEEELTASVSEALETFNSAWSEGEEKPASLNSCTLSENKASLLIDFKDPAAYLEFMARYPDEESPVQVKSMEIAAVEGLELSGIPFQSAAGKNKGTSVSAEEVKKQSKLTAAVVEGAALIRTDGEIQYVSEGVTVTGNSEARTPEEGISYIVFK